MIDPQANPRTYLRLIALVAVLGAVSSLITFVFIFLVKVMSNLVWSQVQAASGLDARLFTLIVCAGGGLLVGLLVRFFGDHSGIFAEVMQEFGKTGRFNYRHAPGIVITALVSLVSGASLGPEAPLADACGSLGTWASDRFKLSPQETRSMGFSGVSAMLAAFITAPLGGAVLGLEAAQGGSGEDRKEYFWVLFPSLVASAAATVVYVLLSGTFFETLYQFPQYSPRLVDLFYAVPLGLLGGVVGLLFMLSLKELQKLFLPMKKHLVLRGVIGGLGMGVIGALLPLTLFSGESQMKDLMSGAAQIGVLMLIVLGLTKLGATILVLSTGWKGGYIFPILFSSVALGMALDLLFPNIPTPVAVAATMAGVLVAVLRAPLFSALFCIVLVQKETAAVVAVAVVASGLLSSLVMLLAARRAAAREKAAG
jgi:H+/Cl- antiporter ClcA